MADEYADTELPQPSERFLAGMALAQTPRQQEIAGTIYRSLAAGAEVDDVKDLIERMVRTVAKERHGQEAPAESAWQQDDPAERRAEPEQPRDTRRADHLLTFDPDDDR